LLSVCRLRAPLERLNPPLPLDATAAAVDGSTRDGSAMRREADRELD
jgi:hypothetical protein